MALLSSLLFQFLEEGALAHVGLVHYDPEGEVMLRTSSCYHGNVAGAVLRKWETKYLHSWLDSI